MKKAISIVGVLLMAFAAVPCAFALPQPASSAAGSHIPEKAVDHASDHSNVTAPSEDAQANITHGPLSPATE